MTFISRSTIFCTHRVHLVAAGLDGASSMPVLSEVFAPLWRSNCRRQSNSGGLCCTSHCRLQHNDLTSCRPSGIVGGRAYFLPILDRVIDDPNVVDNWRACFRLQWLCLATAR